MHNLYKDGAAHAQSGSPPSGSVGAVEFIKALFEHTVEQVYICSFSNDRDDPNQVGERHVITRTPAQITSFAEKWDKPGRGLFFCVGTVKAGAKRNKDNIVETIVLHADIDFKNVDLLGADPRGDVLRHLARLKYIPSATVFSGNGIHAYWLLTESLATQENIERIEMALRQLADVVAGDLAVCEVARVMRMPYSHNSKNGAWSEVEVISLDGDRRYELDDLEEWLSEVSPILLRRKREHGATLGERDPFLEYANQCGYRPPIDVEQRLNAMIYMGSGDSSIHQTQIQCAASMLSRGAPVDEVVAVLLAATKVAAGEYGARWNWRIEERNIRRDCMGWLKKHPPKAKVEAKAKPDLKSIEGGKAEQEQEATVQHAASSGGAASTVVQLPIKKKKDVPAVAVGGVINAIRQDGRDILLAEGEVWIYEDGIWHIMTAAEEQWLRSLIQIGFDRLNEPKKTAALNNCWKLLTEHPELFKREVEWADDKVIVCGNGVLDIDTREFHPHGAQWFARRKISTDYMPGAECPQFIKLLHSMFSLHASPELAVEMYREWLGSALAIPRLTREQRKALLVVGKSRSGKTELSSCARALIGEPVASPSVSEISETFGMQNFIGKSAWIRDDAINEGDRLDPQRFKIIVTGEPIAIRRMAQHALETRLQIPVLLTANSLPRARDASDAVYNRSIVLKLDRVIGEKEAVEMRAALGVPAGLSIGAHIMEQEASGVLNWALEGLRRLLERGSFDVPDSVSEDIREFKEGNNPVAEFARTAITKSANSMVERADVLCAYHGWLREEEGEEARASGARWFFPKLRQALDSIGDHRNGKRAARFLTGVALTDEGLRHWHSHRTGQQLKGGSAGFSVSTDDVNRLWGDSEPDESSPF
jgi:P4 family phage/plasmid primase-like protien